MEFWIPTLFLCFISCCVSIGVSDEILRMEKDEDIEYLKEYQNTFAFASYYQNNMVLQMEPHRAVVWGYGTVGATVNISVNIQDVYSTKVREGFDGHGVWSIQIKPQPAGQVTDIQGVHDNFGGLQWILLRNVLFGDVWICSGQSNMQFTVNMLFNATKELNETVNYPNIRLFTVAEHFTNKTLYDLEEIEEGWSIPSPDTVGGKDWSYFSAVCWLYGRYLYDALQIPIGLVATNWGGTRVEAWSPPYVIASCDAYDGKNYTDLQDQNENSVLWNAMIHPLLNMTIKGAIWYQGEANALYNQDKYQCMFPGMIQSWRKEWQAGSYSSTDPEFPFGFVQLSTRPVNQTGSFPLIRWHQTADMGYVPNDKMPQTFMSIALDLPDNESPFGIIHPRDKQDVAHRLVAAALSIAYHHTTVFDGPFPEKIYQTFNHDVIIEYSHYQQLAVTEQNNFQICCQASTCDVLDPETSTHWLGASILDHDEHTITLNARNCSDLSEYVKMVRYAWALAPCKFKQCSVYNTEGLPAPPFTLDVGKK